MLITGGIEMEIRFSQEEQLIGASVKTIIEHAPVATVKVGAGIAKTGVKLGFGLAKSFFTAGKVLVTSASAAYNEYQENSRVKELERIVKEQQAKLDKQGEAIEAEIVNG